MGHTSLSSNHELDGESNECTNARVELSPGSSQYYIPNCDSGLKPYVSKKFGSLDEAEKFYEAYGASCGFDTRLGPIKRSKSGIILVRYVYCNRQGEKHVASNCVPSGVDSTTKKRRRVSTRCSCMAHVALKFDGYDGYIVDSFDERHSHNLISENYRHFMKANRKLDFAHKSFVLNCARANIGPMKSYRLFKEVVGSYSDVGCTGIEFKNFSRELRAYIVGVDAQIVLDRLFNKREVCSDFTFDFCVDENDRLTRLFWADPISRKNYKLFGDAVAFDGTYETNKYNMIFAPFTGKDNHGMVVTFGAGLLSSEDVEAYSWLLEKFKMCMGNGPNMIITDQDPALKIAVQRVLPDTQHRLCMWHIMRKVSVKVPNSLKQDLDFVKKFNHIVWSENLEPSDFEHQWDVIMAEFGLTDDSWFKSMYNLRHNWIPAFFRDFQMGGIFRTTSISECVNSFFGKYLNSHDNLAAFFMHFDSAMDSQRHTHQQMSSKDETCFPELRTELQFEKHVASIYTHKIFAAVQEDIAHACYVCRISNVTRGDDVSTYEIDDHVDGVFSVIFDRSQNSATCNCKKFLKVGLLCSHIFFVFKDIKLESIPDKYVVRRWTKKACVETVDIHKEQLLQATRMNDTQSVLNKLHSKFYACVGLVDGNTDDMKSLLKVLQDFEETFKMDRENALIGNDKSKMFERFYDSAIPNEVSILPPVPVKNKGSGSRLISRKEKAMQVAKKPLRKCNNCKQMANHDKRNCKNTAPGNTSSANNNAS